MAEKTEKKTEAKAKSPKKEIKTTKAVKSNDFAVVNIKNSQEKVYVGDIISINKIEGEAGSKLKFDEVFLTNKDGATKVGKPKVEGAEVEVEIVEHLRGPKLHIKTYKAKTRNRRHVGHRQELTKIKITNIKF